MVVPAGCVVPPLSVLPFGGEVRIVEAVVVAGWLQRCAAVGRERGASLFSCAARRGPEEEWFGDLRWSARSPARWDARRGVRVTWCGVHGCGVVERVGWWREAPARYRDVVRWFRWSAGLVSEEGGGGCGWDCSVPVVAGSVLSVRSAMCGGTA